MTFRKMISLPQPVRSDFEIRIQDAIKKHAAHPEMIQQIDQLAIEFRALHEDDGIDAYTSALEQLGLRLERIGVREPSSGKSSDGAKKSPHVKGPAQIRIERNRVSSMRKARGKKRSGKSNLRKSTPKKLI